MRVIIFTVFLITISFSLVYGESHPEYFAMENPSYYELEIDEHLFSIPYEVNSQVIAMAIDPELTSFLIGLEKTQDSIFIIDLDHKIISAENNEFAILVNGLEVDYEIVSDSNSSTFTFFVPEFTEEIEIIGTKVIPEFPLGVISGMILLLIVVLMVSKTKVPLFRL